MAETKVSYSEGGQRWDGRQNSQHSEKTLQTYHHPAAANGL